MSIECGECERDARSGHDKGCSRYDPAMEACTCDPEWRADCPVHAIEPVGGVSDTASSDAPDRLESDRIVADKDG